MKCDEESIVFDLKVGLPNFDDGPNTFTQAPKAPVQQPNIAIINNLPSLDDLDFQNP